MNPLDGLRKVFSDMGPSGPRLVNGRPTPQRQRYIHSPQTADVFTAEDRMRAQVSDRMLAGPAIQEFVDDVLGRPWPGWRVGQPWAAVVTIDQQTPVGRYRSGVITVPSPIRELIVLHELAHHFVPPRFAGPDPHDMTFVRAFLDLIDGTLGAASGDIFRDELDKLGVAR